jgi:uncharacterized protein (UPF0548 family)
MLADTTGGVPSRVTVPRRAAPLWEGGDVFVIGAPTDEKLATILERVHDSPLTYAAVGVTLAASATPGGSALDAPAGYRGAHARRTVGHGDADFVVACAALRAWQLHRGQGFRVAPADPPLAVGTEVVTAVPLAGPVHVLAACRVVGVVDEPDRLGFAYGTLAVHPASGEEAFVVTRTSEGEVVGEVTAFSRPRHPLVRLGGPVARRQQARATEGYLDALARHVRDASS